MLAIHILIGNLPEGEHLLEEVLQPRTPLFQEAWAEFGYDTLWWERRHGSLKVGKGPYQLISEVVKLGVSLADVHVAPLYSSS